MRVRWNSDFSVHLLVSSHARSFMCSCFHAGDGEPQSLKYLLFVPLQTALADPLAETIQDHIGGSYTVSEMSIKLWMSEEGLSRIYLKGMRGWFNISLWRGWKSFSIKQHQVGRLPSTIYSVIRSFNTFIKPLLKESRTLWPFLPTPCLPPAFCLWKTVSQSISLIREVRKYRSKGKLSNRTKQ